jgi:hypothetical protein
METPVFLELREGFVQCRAKNAGAKDVEPGHHGMNYKLNLHINLRII